MDLLAQNSGGDIRTAINGLQFSCMQGEDMKQPMVEIINFFFKIIMFSHSFNSFNNNPKILKSDWEILKSDWKSFKDL